MKRSGSSLSGRLKVLGDNVNTDLIHNPFDFTIERKKLNCELLGCPPGKKERSVFLAGRNFGLGSSRFSTALALRNSNLAAALAVSFSRIFERNLACAGIFPVKLAPGITGTLGRIRENDAIRLVFSRQPGGSFYSVDAGLGSRRFPALGAVDGYLYEIAECGGMAEYLAKTK